MADNLSAAASMAAAATSKAKMGAEIVTQTLDTLNSSTYSGKSGGSDGGMSDTYNFSKQVLSSVYEGKGTIADSKG